MENMSEYDCDRCQEYVPDGSGLYFGDDRLCEICYIQVVDEAETAIIE